MVALAYAQQSVMGTTAVIDGLSIAPAIPATLSVVISPGSISRMEIVDSIPFGSIGSDPGRTVFKQGLLLDAVNLTVSPPAAVGQEIVWLIQAAISEIDTDNAVLPYVNANDPSVPFSGPGGEGTQQPQARQCRVGLSIKSGIAATAGTGVAPSADIGYIPLYTILVSYGATTVSSNSIKRHAAAPFLDLKLPQVARWVQSGSYAWGADVGSANQIVVTLDPAPVELKAGFRLSVKKIQTANTGPMTVVVNGLPAVSILSQTSAQLAEGDMPAGFVPLMIYDGQSFILSGKGAANSSGGTTVVETLNALSGEGIEVKTNNTVNFAFPTLSAADPLLGNETLALYRPAPSAGKTKHQTVTVDALIARVITQVPPPPAPVIVLPMRLMFASCSVAGINNNVLRTPSSMPLGWVLDANAFSYEITRTLSLQSVNGLGPYGGLPTTTSTFLFSAPVTKPYSIGWSVYTSQIWGGEITIDNSTSLVGPATVISQSPTGFTIQHGIWENVSVRIYA
ncbi:MAG: hypothetical protein ABL901_03035 [Hyphomicrobiaceae bacterium]